MKNVGLETVKKMPLVTVSLIILVTSTVYLSLFPSTNVNAWSTHMKFVNNTPFPLKFQIEAGGSCTAQPNQTCSAGAEYVWYNTYICPGVYPFDDNGTLTESKCSLAAYEFFKYAEPELVKALEEIAQALEEAEEDGDEDDVDMLTQLNSTVGGINADFAKGYYVLAWTSGIYGTKTVYATLDPSNGKFSLKD
jgi:hypothetical protein